MSNRSKAIYQNPFSKAIKSHVELLLLYINPIYMVLPDVVVVGRTMSAPALYIALNAKLRAVPLSFIRIAIFCPFTGVPNGAPKVAVAACVVITNKSSFAIFGVGVELLVMVVTLVLIRLLVKVSIPASVERVPVSGKVTLVVAVETSVVANEPEVVKAPPSVIMLPLAFAMPVPPFSGFKMLAPTAADFDKSIEPKTRFAANGLILNT